MKGTRHTTEQIIRKLQTAEQLIAQGKTVADSGVPASGVTQGGQPRRSRG